MDLFTLGLLQKNLSGNKGDIKSKNGESSYTITDAVDFPVLGLNLYGKSTQDGTPTPEAPVDIVSVGNNGFDIISKDDTHFNLLSVRDNGGNIITKQPVSVVGKNGETKRFIVSANGSDLRYQWWQNVNSDKGWVIMNTEGARQPIFTIPVAAFRNGYRYRCVVTDGNGNSETSNEVTLYVVSDDCEVKMESIVTDALPLCGIPVDSGGNYTDNNGQQWVCDELVYNADGTGKIVKHTAKYTFTGNENFVLRGNNNAYVYSIYNLLIYKHYSGVRSVSDKYICSDTSFAATEAIKTLKIGENQFFYNDGYPTDNYVYFGSSCTTLEDFKSEISGSTIIYPLAEPQEIPLSAAEMIALRQLMTYSGTTNISNSDNADMDVKYCINQVMADYYPIFAGQGADVQPLVLFQGTDEGYSLADGFTGFSQYSQGGADIAITKRIDTTTESQYGYRIAKSWSIDGENANYTDSVIISSNELVDLTNHNTICIDFYGYCDYDKTSSDLMGAYFKIDKPDTLPQSKVSYDWTGWDNMCMYYRKYGKYYFDVSHLTGKHYLYFGIFHGTYDIGFTNGIKIYKMTLI